jgi:hypothetical protein
MAGNATFLRLPQLIEALENAAESGKPRIRLDLTGVTHLDHACRNQVEEFVAQQRGLGLRVELLMPGPAKPTRTPTPVADMAVGEQAQPTTRTALPRRPYAPSTATATVPAQGPGPTAEWFYLDTRPMPEEYETQPEEYVSR